MSQGHNPWTEDARSFDGATPFWAKLSDDHTRSHPLIAHSADVAAVMGVLLEDGSPFARALAAAGTVRRLTPSHVRQLVFLTTLHDLGKVNHGFQDQRQGTRTFRSWPRSGHVRVVFECAQRDVLAPLILEILKLLPSDEEQALDQLFTSIGHHGRPWHPEPPPAGTDALWRPHPVDGRDPLAAIRDLMGWSRVWSALEAPEPDPLPWTRVFSHLFGGLVTLADWIGSNEDWFPFAPRAAEDPEGYWKDARSRARQACRAAAVLDRTRLVEVEGPSLLKALFPEVFRRFDPTPLQEHLASMVLPQPGARVVIESETGSGKTEAVLALYARLRAAGRCSGLMFALPTRATASAMFERVCAAVGRIYADDAPSVSLAIGGVGPDVAGDALPDSEGRTFPDHDPRSPGDRTWASQHHKRYLAAEIVVGTVDQVLLGGLPVRHAHLRSTLLSRHFLVVDELHSYDRYMTTVLENLLDLLSQAGTVTAFLSATLSESGRRPFGHERSGGATWEDALAVPYPSVSISEPGRPDWRIHATGKDPGSFEKRVHWELTDGERARRIAAEAAAHGARVLFLRNTVRGAVEATEELEVADLDRWIWRPSRAADGTPYHSRYAAPDRRALDRAVLEGFGRAGSAEGVILLSTQVTEQSLDVDFDLLVTDLAPVDVLLQRIGRVHRHSTRTRPRGFEKPRVLVIAPADGVEAFLARGSGPNGIGTVYEDLADLELTRRLIADRPAIRIPAENRLLVESVYHETRRAALEEEEGWDVYLLKAEGRQAAQRSEARHAVIPFSRSGYSEAACALRFERADEERVRTRLSDDTLRVELPESVRCHFVPDATFHHMDIPLRRIQRAGVVLEKGEPAAGVHVIDRGDQPLFAVGEGLTARYSRRGWIWK